MKVASHYTQKDLQKAFVEIGFRPGDIISLQLSLGRLGMLEGASCYEEIANIVIDTLLDLISPNGTLIVPCYTYSIGKGEPFDIEATPSQIGVFPELFRKRRNVIRSRDPMLSNCGIGTHAELILKGISNRCYGEGSVFDRLRKMNAKICTLGIGLHWATYRHYIEEMANVPFRFHKIFNGTIIENGKENIEDWVYFAAPLGVPNCKPDGVPLERLCKKANIVNIANVGRGQILSISAQDFFEFGLKQMKINPWLSAKGPPCSIESFIQNENA